MDTKNIYLPAALFAALIFSAHPAQAVTLKPGDIVVAANIGGTPLPNDVLVVVDPTTGNRTILSGGTVGTGPAITGGYSMSFASDGSLLLAEGDGLMRIDPATGNRTVISGSISDFNFLGTGPTNGWYSSVQFGNQIVLGGGALLYVDPTTGNRTNVLGGESIASKDVIASGNDLIVSSSGSSFSGIVKFDPATGTQTIISGGGVGTGPAIILPTGIVFDGLGNILVSTIPSLPSGEILRIDPLTGDRTIVSGGGGGTGPSLGGFGDQIAVEPNGMILAVDGGYANLLQIDPTTGDRTILSGPGFGTGPVWPATGLGIPCIVVPNVPEPSSIVLLAFGGAGLATAARRRSRAGRRLRNAKAPILILGLLAVVIFASSPALAAPLQPGDIVVTTEFNSTDLGLMIVDPVTGDRTIFSDNTHGTGPDFVGPEGVSVLPDGNLLVGDGHVDRFGQRTNRLIEVDRTTGDRTIISGSGVGSGPDFQTVIGGLSYGNSIVAVDQGLDALLNVDPATGNRTIISGSGVGSGPALSIPAGTAIVGTSAIVANNVTNQLLSVDLTTGNRTVLSGPGVGTGPAFDLPNDVVLGAAGNLIADDTQAIFSVDPATGNRTIISSATVGSGPIWGGLDPWGITTKADGTILMAALFSGALYTIDPVTGNRTILADATHGTGASFVAVLDPVVIPNVPEPSTIALLAIGAMGVLAAARRARRLKR
ncbi:MAG TPA: PEP-CTERM sorting domain-containing protein [Pirellulales bacterium]|nr:PEP-CTERM sorting domain-containing protein [Pirellulales bacterium]